MSVASTEAISAEHYTTTEVATLLNTSVQTVQNLVEIGELPAVNVAVRANGFRPRYRIRKDDVAAFLKRRAVGRNPELVRA
jgi:excisionase family DNA binding protein